MVTHPSILAWRVLWTEEPGGYSPGVEKSRMRLSDYHFHASHTQTGGQQNHLSQHEEEVTINTVDSQAPVYIIELISTGFGLGNPVISLSWVPSNPKTAIYLRFYESQNCLLLCSVAQFCLTLCDPKDFSPPGSSSVGFSRQEHWNGLSFPSPEDLPNPGI